MIKWNSNKKGARNTILITLCGPGLAGLWITRAKVVAKGIVGVLGGVGKSPIKHVEM